MKFSHLSIFPLLVILLFNFSCQNEETLIGSNLVSENEYIIESYPDNINIITVTALEDSVSATGSKSLIGSYLDSHFGQINSAFYFQIGIPNNEINFNAKSIENISLHIPLDGFYGDTLIPEENIQFEINISQLNENISLLDSVYSNESIFMSTPIMSVSKSLAEIKNMDKLLLDLTSSGFGLNEILALDEIALLDNESFLDAFNGFKLDVSTIESNNGGIIYLDAASDSAYLNIEYLNIDNELESINFDIGSQKKLNHFSHDYTNAPVISDTSSLFVQSMAGSFVQINIPDFNVLISDGYIGVNYAKLNIPISTENGSYPRPENLLLYLDNPEFELVGGGILNNETNSYEFNITNYIQLVMNQEADTTLNLYTASRSSNANRVVLENTFKNPAELTLFLIKSEN